MSLFTGQPHAIATGLGNLGQVFKALRRLLDAVECVKESRRIMEEAGLARERDYILCLNTLGLLYRELNQEDLAQEAFTRGLVLAEETGDRMLCMLLLAHVSIAHWFDSNWDAAMPLHLKALEAAAELNDAQDVVLNLHNIARCLLEAGRFDAALCTPSSRCARCRSRPMAPTRTCSRRACGVASVWPWAGWKRPKSPPRRHGRSCWSTA